MELDYRVIGSRIQARRKQKKITQEKMAEALNLSVGFISQIERGVTKLSLDSMAAIHNIWIVPFHLSLMTRTKKTLTIFRQILMLCTNR